MNNSTKLFESVIRTSRRWKNSDKIMYVVGAKNTKEIGNIRKITPDSYILVPGIGAQGGNLKEICKHGLDEDLKLIVNSSRSIIYASDSSDFAQMAENEAKKIQTEMEKYLNNIV